MSYKVTWRPSAEQQLAGLWVNASDQNDVGAAADRIDDLLERGPLGCGGNSVRREPNPPGTAPGRIL